MLPLNWRQRQIWSPRLDLAHPFVGSVLIPLSLSLILTGASLAVSRDGRARRPAAAAIGLALLTAQAVVFGLPSWPPASGPDKLPWLLATLLIGGVLMDLLRPARPVTIAVTMIAVVTMSLWLAWPQLGRGDSALLVMLGLAATLGLVCIGALAATPAEGASRATVVIVAALALAGSGFQAGSLSLMQVALAIAAASGGFALWNWPRARLPLHATGIAVGGLGCVVIALLLLLLTDIRPVALLAVAAVFAAGPLSRYLPVPGRWSRRTVEPLYVVAIAVLPLVAAVLLSTPPEAPDDLYYR